VVVAIPDDFDGIVARGLDGLPPKVDSPSISAAIVARRLRLELARAPLSLAGRLAEIRGAIFQVLMLPMLDLGQDLAHGRPTTSQLARDDHSWNVLQAS
jgi:hypothetical protein